MSTNNFKPFHEQAAGMLADQLKAGTSPLQKPWKDDNTANFIIPFNQDTGKNYKGLNALYLLMQDKADPRWMTSAQAGINGFQVEKESKGAMISYLKTSDLQPVRDAQGNKIPDENNKPQLKTVEMEKAAPKVAFVFNGEQITGLPPYVPAEKPSNTLERTERILEESKAVIIEGGTEAYYKPVADVIHLPEMSSFESPEKYYAAAIHQLAHWSGHESRLDRPMNEVPGSKDYAKEALRAEIATLLISSELNLGHELGKRAQYVYPWIGVLKNNPFEIVRAANDAQKIANMVLGFEKKKELKQETARGFEKGESIPYNGTEYKVLDVLKNKSIKVEDLEGNRTTVKPEHGLYASLLNAKNNAPELEMAQEEQVTHKIGR